jgi:hypothetical protein
MRGLLIILLLLSTGAMAEEPKLPPGVTCVDVRAKVDQHGQYVAYAWARLNGYSRAQIKEARKCLLGP